MYLYELGPSFIFFELDHRIPFVKVSRSLMKYSYHINEMLILSSRIIIRTLNKERDIVLERLLFFVFSLYKNKNMYYISS